MKVLNLKKTKIFLQKNNLLFVVLIIILFLSASCSQKPVNVLSQHDMIAFLTDMHKLEGVLIVKNLNNIEQRENVYYYNALFEKYKITKEQFDSSLVWYTRNPKKFAKIYKTVLTNLNDQDSLVNYNLKLYEDSLNRLDKKYEIWNKNKNYILTKDSTNDQIDFNIQGYEFMYGDKLTLKFLHRGSPTDSDYFENIVLKVHYLDGFTDSIQTKLISDSLLRRYTMHFKARYNKKINNISGVLSHVNLPEKRIRTVFDSINLSYEYSPVVHDSLKLMAKQKIENEPLNLKDSLQSVKKLPHLPFRNSN